MPYTVTPTHIPDVLILEPKVFGDARGFFFESFNQQDFKQVTGLDVNFVQDNHSRSAKGVLRGLHYQLQQAQGKLVRVVGGAVFDVAVDIRKSSPTFGQWAGVELTEDNHSRSAKGVLRGLHYQLQQAQGKLVRVVRGAVFDVAVDIRKSSPTFGQWAGVELTEDNHKQFWVPPGFAHGFVVLSETADFLYKTTDYYAPAHERCIAWNDPAIGITWPQGMTPQLSVKDQAGLMLVQAEVFA